MSRFIYSSVYSNSMISKEHWRLLHTDFDCKSDLSKKEGNLNGV